VEILVSNLNGKSPEITQSVFLLVCGDSLEGLFVSPCRTDTVDLAVVPVIVTSLSQCDFLGDGMFGLCSR
jgi:hypothetical protein